MLADRFYFMLDEYKFKKVVFDKGNTLQSVFFLTV